jgi:hypothetical protein
VAQHAKGALFGGAHSEQHQFNHGHLTVSM